MNLSIGERKLNLEFLLYTAIVIVSVFFRFITLGVQPLDDHEAGLALQSLRISNGEEVQISGQPGVIAINSILFFLLGASDLLARIVPALFGVCLVLVPLLCRQWIGRSTALLLALFLALDPLMISVSRTSDGSTLAMLGLLAGIGFWLNRRPVLSGISFGAALLGGVHLWAGLVVLVVVFLLFRKNLTSSEENVTQHHAWEVVASAAITVLTVSTLLLLNPSGISGIGTAFVAYLTSWSQVPSVSLETVAISWLLVELPLIIIAVWGGIHASFRKDGRMLPLVLWWVLGFIIALFNPTRSFISLYWTSIPLLLIASIGLRYVFDGLRLKQRMVVIAEAGLVVVLLVFSFLNTVNLLNSPYLAGDAYQNRLIGAVLPLILLVAVTFLLAWGWSAASTRTGLVIGVFLVLGFTLISSSSRAAGITGYPENNLNTGSGYPVGRSLLVGSIEDLSKWSTGIDHRLDVQVAGLEIPSLEWQLREFENLTVHAGYNPNFSPSVVITPLTTEIETAEAYRGQKITWSVRPDTNNMKLNEWLKWSLFRIAPQEKEEILLWAKNDLFPGSTNNETTGDSN